MTEAPTPPALSVVLATQNRAASLGRLLSGLRAQAGAPPFEVVVADNGSIDDTPAVLAGAARHLRLRSVRAERPGKSRALNVALRLASGDLLVFTDDDVRPDPAWLAELHAAAVEHPSHSVFGGRIEVGRDSVPAWIRRSHNLMGLLTSEHDRDDAVYDFGSYPFGPNMAVRRDLIAGLEAPYPEDMGPGTDLPVGDESGFLLPLSAPAAGDRLYVPSARVFHEVEPGNLAFREAMRRSYLQGRAQGRLGIPVVPSGGGRKASFLRLGARRVWACGSLRELACVFVRHVGFLLGSRVSGARRPAAPAS